MDFFDVFGKAWASESPTIFLVVAFFTFGVFVLRWLQPGMTKVADTGNKFADLGEKFIDDVAKPLLPIAGQAIGALEVYGKTLEAQTRSNQQMADALLDRDNDVRELFEVRIKAVLERVGELETGMRKLTEENIKLIAENKALKDELAAVKKKSAEDLAKLESENRKLRDELADVKKELNGNAKKA